MARISGVDLQDNWKVDYALTHIKGVGWALSRSILGDLKIDPVKRVSDLEKEEITKIAAKIEDFPTEGDLIRKIRNDISRLQATGSYRGIRHKQGLPVRGQRTRSNARTKRGKRKTVGAFRKEALAKVQQQKAKEK